MTSRTSYRTIIAAVESFAEAFPSYTVHFETAGMTYGLSLLVVFVIGSANAVRIYDETHPIAASDRIVTCFVKPLDSYSSISHDS